MQTHFFFKFGKSRTPSSVSSFFLSGFGASAVDMLRSFFWVFSSVHQLPYSGMCPRQPTKTHTHTLCCAEGFFFSLLPPPPPSSSSNLLLRINFFKTTILKLQTHIWNLKCDTFNETHVSKVDNTNSRGCFKKKLAFHCTQFKSNTQRKQSKSK